jgi:hypothetical protein
MRLLMILAGIVLFGGTAGAESDSDTHPPLVRGGAYDKPNFASLGRGGTTVGGYAEAHFRYEEEEGILKERTFVPKRFNLFFHSAVSDRFRMAAELEFEEGTEEILLELAILDFEIHSALSFRAGMILTPLGKFNLAHDSPSNKTTDRPLVSTQIIPTALSEPGMGIFGAFYPSARSRITYELYAVNGFDGDVVEESDEGTRIAEGRHNFEDNNNSPAFAGRIGFSPIQAAEAGFSWHHGQYNTTFLEDISVDEARDLTLWALDADYHWDRFEFVGEYAQATIELPPSLQKSIYAGKQKGFYLQGSASFLKGFVQTIPEGLFEGVVRYDRVDMDADLDGDHQTRLTLGLNFKPTPESVFKFNYFRNWNYDRNNVKGIGAGVLVSVATYF